MPSFFASDQPPRLHIKPPLSVYHADLTKALSPHRKDSLFWHLTTRSVKKIKIPRRKKKFYPAGQAYIDDGRYPDLRRCERLPWVRASIEKAGEPEVLAWDYEEGDLTIKTYVWLKDYDFTVIMKRFPDNKRRLITSFYVDKSYKRKDFERKYANRIK